MKKIDQQGKSIYVLSIALYLACLCARVNASIDQTEIVNGRQWNYFIDNETATIGHKAWPPFAIDKDSIGDVIIPETIGEYPVRFIGSNAFDRRKFIKSVTIPEGVFEIRDAAFSSCTNLASITLPSTITNIDSRVFFQCTSLTNITLPNNLHRIKKSTFEMCTSLRLLQLPLSLEAIDDFAFRGCTNLHEIHMGANVLSLGESCFSGCADITNATLSLSITNIEAGAFAGCRALQSIVIPSGVKKIGRDECTGAFSGCTSLNSVVLSEGVKDISSRTFSNCRSLMSLTIPNSVTNIGITAFANSGLRSVVIGHGVQAIGTAAFANNGKLTSVEFRGDAPQFGQYVFSGLMLGGILGVGAPTNCVFRIHHGTTGWNIIEPSSTNESPRIQFDGRFFPVEYVDNDTQE